MGVVALRRSSPDPVVNLSALPRRSREYRAMNPAPVCLGPATFAVGHPRLLCWRSPQPAQNTNLGSSSSRLPLSGQLFVHIPRQRITVGAFSPTIYPMQRQPLRVRDVIQSAPTLPKSLCQPNQEQSMQYLYNAVLDSLRTQQPGGEKTEIYSLIASSWRRVSGQSVPLPVLPLKKHVRVCTSLSY